MVKSVLGLLRAHWRPEGTLKAQEDFLSRLSARNTELNTWKMPLEAACELPGFRPIIGLHWFSLNYIYMKHFQEKIALILSTGQILHGTFDLFLERPVESSLLA